MLISRPMLTKDLSWLMRINFNSMILSKQITHIRKLRLD